MAYVSRVFAIIDKKNEVLEVLYVGVDPEFTQEQSDEYALNGVKSSMESLGIKGTIVDLDDDGLIEKGMTLKEVREFKPNLAKKSKE